MHKLFLIFILLLFSSNISYSQEIKDTIKLQEDYSEYKTYDSEIKVVPESNFTSQIKQKEKVRTYQDERFKRNKKENSKLREVGNSLLGVTATLFTLVLVDIMLLPLR